MKENLGEQWYDTKVPIDAKRLDNSILAPKESLKFLSMEIQVAKAQILLQVKALPCPS
jgi:hypothetical protein